jgi:RHS repeat-associated protein
VNRESGWVGDIERLKDLDVGIDMAYYRGMDPTTGRWMQVDPKAEAAGSMSPYSSMGNNPISQVDPNGDLPFLAVAAIGAFTSVISNGINNHKRGQDFFAGAGEAALWGAASATVSGQVGAAFGNIGSVTNEIFRALAHGVTQGGLSAIQGNGFMNGALSGAVSSGVGSGTIRRFYNMECR